VTQSESAVNIAAALERIRYRGSRAPDLQNLRALQHAFLESVPFENLDIHIGRKISLDPARIHEKIVVRRRGGFCYECNGLFADLLASLGYEVSRHSARMSLGDRVGPEFDHMVLLVALDRVYLVDVGNGQSVRDPLPLVGDDLSEAEGVEYRVATHPDGYALYHRQAGAEWRPRFLFSTMPRKPSEFAGMCEFHQTSPDSVFTKQRLATIATPEGRLTLLGRRFTEVQGSERIERDLTSEPEMFDLLRRRFGIDLTES
jgi:N-hydroxyarylamine O-acetyltransferase